MTVAELIDRLLDVDPNLDVKIEFTEGGKVREIKRVENVPLEGLIITGEDWY